MPTGERLLIYTVGSTYSPIRASYHVQWLRCEHNQPQNLVHSCWSHSSRTGYIQFNLRPWSPTGVHDLLTKVQTTSLLGNSPQCSKLRSQPKYDKFVACIPCIVVVYVPLSPNSWFLWLQVSRFAARSAESARLHVFGHGWLGASIPTNVVVVVKNSSLHQATRILQDWFSDLIGLSKALSEQFGLSTSYHPSSFLSKVTILPCLESHFC